MPQNAAEFADPYAVEALDALDDAADPPSPEVKILLDSFQKDLDAALHAQTQDGFDPREHFNLQDPTERTVQLYNIQESLITAKILADGMEFASPEQRQEFAGLAAQRVLDALHPPKDLSPNGWENLEHADHLAIVGAAIADRLSVYDTAGRREMDRQTAFAVQFLSAGTDPEQADGYFSSYARLQSHRREGPLDTSPEFTPERYQHEALTQFQQSLLNNAFLSLLDHFPHTAACPGMDYQSQEELTARGAGLAGAGEVHQALWRELKLVFDNQDFPSKGAAQEAAAEIAAEILQGSFHPQDPESAARPERRHLEKSLAEWLSAERPEFLSQGRENFQMLQDAMAFAESQARPGRPAPLDFPQLNAAREHAGLGAAAQGVLLLTQENFQSSLETLALADLKREQNDPAAAGDPAAAAGLKLIVTPEGYLPEPQAGYQPGATEVIAAGYRALLTAVHEQDAAAFDQAAQFQKALNETLRDWAANAPRSVSAQDITDMVDAATRSQAARPAG